MKPICFIAARGGSKGVPGKNIKDIAGKPLIAYTIEAAINSKIFDEVIVSTDSNNIAEIAEKYGAKIPFMRPKKLSTDHISMDKVLLHAIHKLFEMGYKFEIMVNRDCTVPFISKDDILGSLNILKKEKCDLVCGVYKQHHNPYFNMMEPKNNGFLKFSKKSKKKITLRQNAPVVYQLTGLFTFNVSRFLKFKRMYMPKTLPYEISEERGLMIDTKYEFKLAEILMKNKKIFF